MPGWLGLRAFSSWLLHNELDQSEKQGNSRGLSCSCSFSSAMPLSTVLQNGVLVVQVHFFFFFNYNTKAPSLFVWCTVEHRIIGPEQEETWAMFKSWLGSLSKSILESSSDLKLSLILHQGVNMETIPLWCTPWKSLPVAQVCAGVRRCEQAWTPLHSGRAHWVSIKAVPLTLSADTRSPRGQHTRQATAAPQLSMDMNAGKEHIHFPSNIWKCLLKVIRSLLSTSFHVINWWNHWQCQNISPPHILNT